VASFSDCFNVICGQGVDLFIREKVGAIDAQSLGDGCSHGLATKAFDEPYLALTVAFAGFVHRLVSLCFPARGEGSSFVGHLKVSAAGRSFADGKAASDDASLSGVFVPSAMDDIFGGEAVLGTC